MMKVANAEEMQELDRKAIETYRIPGMILMENAGRGAAEVISNTFPDIHKKKIAIIAGKGNNGGDGFVIARYLLNQGVSVRVYLLTDPKGLRGDAETNFNIFQRMKGEVISVPSSKDYVKVKKDLEKFDILVDGIFGTGLDAEVRGYYREVIDHLNTLQRPIVAIDIPSGLDADTGKPLGTAIRASLTVTFGLPKVGHLIPPGIDYVGEVKVIDIGIPKRLVEDEKIPTHLLEEKEIKRWLSIPRNPDTHKGDYGHLLVIAGSVGKTGAAALACQAALRMGAGLVTLAIPKSLNGIMEMKLTEVMTEPLPETPKQTLSLRAFSAIVRLCENKKAVIIGPGLGTFKETQSLILKLIKALDVPIILDADGLTALATQPKTLPITGRSLILTPHPGEMARLTRSQIKEVLEDRIGLSRNFSQSHHVHLVLKGHPTLISTPKGEVFINPTGNPGMASGGTGDVLTGMIGGLVCQGFEILPSLQIAVYLHGLAGDEGAQEKGEKSLIATDIIEKIPALLKGRI
ncbi:MAG: NAD(P)H-hydrate dehydratase [Deltaproteobacteria bacterium]|jgi:NAD(P)H-hydrate epimerase|nr:NAD(P)H-hydrate dehydratase [Deltaproteobacteria bacterium]